MKTVNLGKSDLKISEIGVGAWQAGGPAWGTDFTDDDIIKALRWAIENGMNYIDTAEGYGNGHSEEVIRKAIEGYDRESFVIATKVAPPHFKYDDVIKAADKSLKRMNLKYIDLYQLHWPTYEVPLSETMRAMEHLLKLGKIRYIGVCNFSKAHTKEAEETLSGAELVSNQVRYNLLQRGVEDELAPYLKDRKISLIAWSPIAKGLLSGKYSATNLPTDDIRKSDLLFKDQNIIKLDSLFAVLDEISKKYNKSKVQVSLNWLLSKEAVPIPGVKNVNQAKSNADASGWYLSENDVKLLDDASKIEFEYF